MAQCAQTGRRLHPRGTGQNTVVGLLELSIGPGLASLTFPENRMNLSTVQDRLLVATEPLLFDQAVVAAFLDGE